MANINDLPTELLCHIFDDVFSSSHSPPFDYTERHTFYEDVSVRRSHDCTPCQRAVVDEVWNYEEFGNVALCPFSLTSVCQRWYHILEHFPKFWTHVVFDISRPVNSLRLDSFILSSTSPLMLYIFSNECTITKSEENARVATVINNLHQHLGRCTSIIFQLQYSSSLPPLSFFLTWPGLCLEELRLESRIDDRIPRPVIMSQAPLSSLRHLNLSGKIFMTLCSSDTQDVASIGSLSGLSLQIFDLALTTNQYGDQSQYTDFNSFMKLLECLFVLDLCLSRINLISPPRKRRNIDRSFDVAATHQFKFLDVSSSFLSDFFNSSFLVFAEPVIFVRCTIPRVRGPIGGELELHDIPCDAPPRLVDQSLRNILAIWEGAHLTLSACLSLTDDTLGWLATREVATSMTSMSMRDCPKITALGVRHLLTMRDGRDTCVSLTHLEATGNVPHLEEDDLQWFKRWKKESQLNVVEWTSNRQ